MNLKVDIKKELPDDDYSEQSGKLSTVLRTWSSKNEFHKESVIFLFPEHDFQNYNDDMEIGEEFKTEPIYSQSIPSDVSKVTAGNFKSIKYFWDRYFFFHWIKRDGP